MNHDPFRAVAIHVISTLPDEISKRLDTLNALLEIAPPMHPLTKEIRELIGHLASHCLLQRELPLNFR